MPPHPAVHTKPVRSLRAVAASIGRKLARLVEEHGTPNFAEDLGQHPLDVGRACARSLDVIAAEYEAAGGAGTLSYHRGARGSRACLEVLAAKPPATCGRCHKGLRPSPTSKEIGVTRVALYCRACLPSAPDEPDLWPEALDAIWSGNTAWLHEHLPCRCCCDRHTTESCPARAYNGCRGGSR